VLDYGPAMKAPAFRAVNPMGKVPAIRHGETVVTEAAAICAYLPTRFPKPGSCRRPATASAARTSAGCSSALARSRRP
jgi:glutathione S-transferase